LTDKYRIVGVHPVTLLPPKPALDALEAAIGVSEERIADAVSTYLDSALPVMMEPFAAEIVAAIPAPAAEEFESFEGLLENGMA